MKSHGRIKPLKNERTLETRALLKILALGNKQIEAGRVQPASEVIQRLRERREID